MTTVVQAGAIASEAIGAEAVASGEIVSLGTATWAIYCTSRVLWSSVAYTTGRYVLVPPEFRYIIISPE
jgi:hypothetical protein